MRRLRLLTAMIVASILLAGGAGIGYALIERPDSAPSVSDEHRAESHQEQLASPGERASGLDMLQRLLEAIERCQPQAERPVGLVTRLLAGSLPRDAFTRELRVAVGQVLACALI